MMWRRAALLGIFLALWACAEGGIRGSGISTSVLGNVVSVQPAGSMTAATDLSGITVTIDGTDITDETDTDGGFALHGTFDGRVTAVFTLPEDGGEARIDLNVPGGGTLTLHDVDVDAQRGEAVPARADVEFTGVVTAVDCEHATLVMMSSPKFPGDVDEYFIDLTTSSLGNAHGMPLPCSEVQQGQHASVSGQANRNGTFYDATIVFNE